jgi:hypothetical protein
MIYKQTNKSSGQSMVEFALILPLLVLFIIMIVDIGRITYYYSTLYNATREGTRQGIIEPDSGAMVAAARRTLIGMTVEEGNIKTTIDTTSVEMQIIYDFVPVTPGAKLILGKEKIPIKSVSKMLIEK